MLRKRRGNLHSIITGGLAIAMLIGGVGVVAAQGEEPVEEPQITPEPQDELPEVPNPRTEDGEETIELEVGEIDMSQIPDGISLATLGTYVRIADIYAGPESSYPDHMAVYNSKLYFSAITATTGYELWVYDGVNLPSLVVDIWTGSNSSSPRYLAAFKNKLYFSTDIGDGKGRELWSYDGISAKRVRDINPSGSSDPAHLAVFNNKLYFSADGGDGRSFELWVYDGVNQPKRAADICSGASGSYPHYLQVFSNKLYFSANGCDGKGIELWAYDGINKPKRVADIYSGAGHSQPSHLEVFNKNLYFSADGNNEKGTELWVYDGVNPPSLMADIKSGPNGSYPSFFKVFRNVLFFEANGDGQGSELWAYDGIQAPFRVADIYAGPLPSTPGSLTVFGDGLYFAANGGDENGRELWRYQITNVLLYPSCSMAGYDGYVRESSETSSKGGSKNSTGSTLWVGDDKSDRQYRVVLHFDTSPLPENAVILYAQLGVRRAGVVGTNPFKTHGTIKVDMKKGAFSGVDDLQLEDFQATASKSAAATFKNNPDTEGVYLAKIPSLYYKCIDRAGVTQFRLRFSKDDNDDRAADYIKFFSGENAFPYCPQLWIWYSQP